MSSGLKKWIFSVFVGLALFGLIRLYYRLTDDFRLSNISHTLPFEAPWKTLSTTSEEQESLRQIFSQKFVYLGKGAQCYAFASEDGQYVLKFFKFKHLKPNLFVENLPSISLIGEYKNKCIERKKRKLYGVFNGYDLAFRESPETSALIYLHLNPTDHLHLNASLIDKMGFEKSVRLDDVVFLLQKKGETLRTRLTNLLDESRVDEAKMAFASILEMYISEYSKGIYDHDHGVLHNTGFVGSRPFHLDVGKLNKDIRMQNPEFYKKDLEHVVWKMDFWVKQSYPGYYPEISDFLSQQYEKLTGGRVDFGAIDPQKFKKRGN